MSVNYGSVAKLWKNLLQYVLYLVFRMLYGKKYFSGAKKLASVPAGGGGGAPAAGGTAAPAAGGDEAPKEG